MPAAERKSPLTLPRLIGLLLIAGLAWLAQDLNLLETDSGSGGATRAAEPSSGSSSASPVATSDRDDEGAALILAASKSRRSGFMVTTAGRVSATLPDDRDGDRHQRFIVRLSNGITVLVAHNIDIAPRVPLDKGDELRLHGQYEWSDKGGVLHWTHHAPRGGHEEGWIEYGGKRYE